MAVMFINTNITMINEKRMALQAAKSELDLKLSSCTYCMIFEKFLHLPEPKFIPLQKGNAHI